MFEKDGSFKCGFVKEKGKWVMATGTYTFTAGAAGAVVYEAALRLAIDNFQLKIFN